MTWKLDTAHSEIGFKLKHMMVATVRGKFREFDADVKVDENDLAASAATFRIKAASVDTGTDQRDEHLRSPAARSRRRARTWRSRVT
jgi:polyisoprenoid-binding protein YceI